MVCLRICQRHPHFTCDKSSSCLSYRESIWQIIQMLKSFDAVILLSFPRIKWNQLDVKPLQSIIYLRDCSFSSCLRFEEWSIWFLSILPNHSVYLPSALFFMFGLHLVTCAVTFVLGAFLYFMNVTYSFHWMRVHFYKGERMARKFK